ncbi:MAG: endonuclease III domain-containing protein [Candidatus Zapsychrus exili]|nr:endonuclease III domain-containing protein [Candidatus Zapsychrus exili]
MLKSKKTILSNIYKSLYAAFGKQHWWPGKTKFEVIVGAILTQNTNWSNVERAINNLRKAKLLTISSLSDIPHKKLAVLIRPAGYFNVKAVRLKNFVDFLYLEYKGSLKKMESESLDVLRERLLSVNGIGPETADSILLYAFNKPIFVVDAYTKRIFSRHKVINKNDDYKKVQDIFMSNLSHDVKIFNEYHALVVRLAKEHCKTKPSCENCPLTGLERYL